jgi:hypothetical protein
MQRTFQRRVSIIGAGSIGIAFCVQFSREHWQVRLYFLYEMELFQSTTSIPWCATA